MAALTITSDRPTFYTSHPASALRRPGLRGPEKSVAEISSVLFNKDRIKSERRAVKRQGNFPLSDFAEFAQPEKEYPGFITFSQFACEKHIILRDAINGIVSDGAHGYFLERTALLLMSFSYCLDLDGWVPGIMTYANGATQDHFFLHFLAMFESMAADAENHGQKITDSMFKNVVDYSGAQRLGYIEAFVAFWKRRKDDSRTEEELRKTASSLLKGCREHFRAQINRDVFASHALALLEAEDCAEFMERVELHIKNFRRQKGGCDEMPVEEWDSIPNTTNAQESQHKKIYLAIGKKHELIPGLRGLRQLAEHYALLAAAASSGIKIRYGIPEPWKHAKTKDGLSKRARAALMLHPEI
ncbi:hypothetical protein B0H11DRAFT_2233320 [Mycena galericulata]|nr:hypothetical protein B0H11DRAFT_2233320 [Mycena galericulata]